MAMLTDAPKVIRWRLREVMARKRITGRDLASALDLHETSVSRLRASDTMPRLDGEQLNALCQALDCTPSDLLEYTPDDEGQEDREDRR